MVIVQTAMLLAVKAIVTVVGEDTDLLVLMLYHDFKLYFRSEKESKKNPAPRTFDIFLCQEVLGRQICNTLLFLHAYTGCDSTSKISKITKPS